MSPGAVLREVVRSLEEAGVEYMLTGSFAGSFHGAPRATQDIDLVIHGTRTQILEFVRSLEPSGFYASEQAAAEAVSLRGQFNVVDPEGGWKIDLILRKDRPFSRTEFGRRRLEDLLGFPVYVATAEDTVLAKLEWARLGDSERQVEDVVGILRAQGARLDEEYIGEWAVALGLSAEWEDVRERARRV